jgi:hypothetical protein
MTRTLLPAVLSMLLVTAPASAGAADQPLGRLFFTPQQRAALDAGRRISSTTKKTESKPAARRGPREVELGGIVTRSDGERTVWINGKPFHNGSPGGVHVTTDPRKPESAVIQLRGSRSAKLRVGQRLDTRSGSVNEKFEPRPAPPASPESKAEAGARAPGAETSEPERAALTESQQQEKSAQEQER